MTNEEFDALGREVLSPIGVSRILKRESSVARPDVDLPLVSCICPTYCRPPVYQHRLEEAIESFLRQTYPNKELVVLNDCTGQELVCNAPGVRVVNAPERFPTLGDTYNAAIALARGEHIAPWRDDDISLPWRLSLSVKWLGDAGYFNPKYFWMMIRDELRPDPRSSIGHNLSLFTRPAFERVGGYPAAGADVDLAFDAALRAHVMCIGHGSPGDGELMPHEIYSIHRRGVSPAHISTAVFESAFGANVKAEHERVGAHPVQQGRFVLAPHWRMDYEAETRTMLAAFDSKIQYTTSAISRIVEATYGTGTDVMDVTAQVQERLHNGHLSLTVSNILFGDPCPNQVKTLRFTYEIAGDGQQYRHEAEEQQIVSLGPVRAQ